MKKLKGLVESHRDGRVAVYTYEPGNGSRYVLQVTDLSGKPLYNAKIHVQIRYGFLGLRKLDLETGTNADGKANSTTFLPRNRSSVVTGSGPFAPIRVNWPFGIASPTLMVIVLSLLRLNVVKSPAPSPPRAQGGPL